MKARIVENLLDTIEEFFGPEEGHRKDPEFLALCERIQGKEVNLVFIGADAQSVNARDLHEFLGVGKMFAHWIKDRIEKYGFAEHEDFEVIAISGKNPLGGRPEIEYHIFDSLMDV